MGVAHPTGPDPRAAPGRPGPGALTPESRSGTGAPSFFPPAKAGGGRARPKGRENQSELLSPLRALMAAAQTQRPGDENVAKDSLPNFPSLCSGGGRGGRLRWAEGRGLSRALHGGHGHGGGGGGAPRARPPGRPLPARARARPPAPDPTGRGGRRGLGRESGRRLPGHPGVPRGPAGVKFTSGWRTVRGPGAAAQSEAARGRRPGSRCTRPRGAAVTPVPRPQLSARSRSWKFPGFAGAGLGFCSVV